MRNKLRNIHPGQVLFAEFLVPMEISTSKLSEDIFIPQNRVHNTIKGNGSITADTALRLSKYFGNSAKFWLQLQNEYDLEVERVAKKEVLKIIKALESKKIRWLAENLDE